VSSVAVDYQEYEFEDSGQRWLASWTSASDDPPEGTNHGSGAVCRTNEGQIVLITQQGQGWDHPAGRPEGNETWNQTLVREVLEEACANVDSASLLGFIRGRCVSGEQEGLILVRSLWVAQVTLLLWDPHHEILDRTVVDESEVFALMDYPSGLDPIYRRWLLESKNH